jgi:hypothetical protein
MSKKRIAFIVLACVAFVVGQGLYSLRAWCIRSRNLQNESILRSLSIEVEFYREKFGSYPSSLGEVSLNTDLDARSLDSLQHTLDVAATNIWRDTYAYTPLSNGFVFTITGPEMAPAGWFGKQRRIERTYSQGEAFGEH